MSNKLYHNPRCSKSREALSLLEKAKAEFEIYEYIKNGLSKKDLDSIVAATGLAISELVRRNESAYKDLKLKSATESQLRSAIIENPKLLQRPIYIKGAKGVVGRPAENVLTLT